ncbi:MAG: hypothetical protein KF723_23540 [Rhizobiaceae bacterium]|nr:hypothetical protein [Rhizobiaceae bacterium]
MAEIHFLNVCNGDCSIIRHNSDRITMIDICNGRTASERSMSAALRSLLGEAKSGLESLRLGGDYGMRDKPTDPIAYLQRLGIGSVFRFILSHPDMDHMDGFKALCDEIGVANFWDSGVRKPKPEFGGNGYREHDWSQYVAVRDGHTSTKVVTPGAGSRFQFANQGDNDSEGGDYLSVVAPSPQLVIAANQDGDVNDGSYVVVYRSAGGRIIFPGDAHDDTWDYVLAHHRDLVANCAVLIAPHHGRKSGRSYGFLDTLRPGLTLFGCAASEHLAYDAWRTRGLQYITNNQAGNVILLPKAEGVDVYVENLDFARTFTSGNTAVTRHGCYFIGQVVNPKQVA